MNRLTASLLASCLLLLAAPAAHADVPTILPFQGYLTDDNGAPIDGTLPFVFTLYDSLNGGTAIFTESQSITVTQGFVNVYIGLSTALDPALFANTTNLYLGIRINQTGEAEMVPRTQIGSVPYAFFAKACGDAETLAGMAPSAFAPAAASVTQGRVTGTCPGGQSIRVINEDGTVTCEVDTDTDTNTTYSAAASGGLALSGTAFSVDPSIAGVGLAMSGGVMSVAPDSGSCSSGQMLKWTGSAWTCQDDLDTDTNTTYSAAASGGLVLSGGNAFSIAADAITSARIADGAVAAADLADNSVDSAELVAGAVENAELADNAVTSAKIADAAVTAAKLGADSVGLRELGALPSGNDVLVDNAFTGPADLLSTSAVSASGASATCMVNVSVSLTPTMATTDTVGVAVLQNVSGGATTASTATARALPVAGSASTTTASVSHVFVLPAGSSATYGCRLTPSGAGYDAGSATCNVSWLCF